MFDTSTSFDMHESEISLQTTIQINLESIVLSICVIVNLALPYVHYILVLIRLCLIVNYRFRFIIVYAID